MPPAATFNNNHETPSEPHRPRPVTRTMSNTLGLSSKKGTLISNAFESPLQSVNQGSIDNSTSDDSGVVSPILGQGAGHGHLIGEMPASSAMAVHGSVPASPLMGQYGSLARGIPRRGNKRTKVDMSVWQSTGLAGHAEAVGSGEETGGVDEVVDQDMEDHLCTSAEYQEIDDGRSVATGVKNGRVIAVDFDDVCCQCMVTYCEGHNELYGTNLTMDDMESYFIHQNKGWGTLAETNRKIKELEGEMARTLPVSGFADALRKLKALGHPLHIVTARHERCKGQIIEWLAKHGITVGFGPKDIIAAIWTTNAFGLNPSEPKTTSTESSAKEQGMSDDDEAMEETESEKEKRHNAELQQMFKAQVASGGSGKRKLQVLRAINASLFIDDHHGNLEPIVHSQPQIPCLLFGKYAWNLHRSGGETPVELMSHEQRVAGGLDLPKHEIELVDGLERAETWEDVINWVQAWDERDATRVE